MCNEILAFIKEQLENIWLNFRKFSYKFFFAEHMNVIFVR